MTQMTQEALTFEGHVIKTVGLIREEISERTAPSQMPTLLSLKEFYDLLPEELQGMIGYNPKSFKADLENLIKVYQHHQTKPCWTKLMLITDALHSKERTEVMVAAAMFNDKEESLVEPKEESWLEKARKRFS